MWNNHRTISQLYYYQTFGTDNKHIDEKWKSTTRMTIGSMTIELRFESIIKTKGVESNWRRWHKLRTLKNFTEDIEFHNRYINVCTV